MKPGKLAKVILKPISPAVFPPPEPGNSPISKLWQIRLKWFGSWRDFLLPIPFWKGFGNPPGSKGYKYNGPDDPIFECRVAVVKPKIIKAVCKGDVLPPPPPHPLPVPVQVGAWDLSDRFCAEFGGTEIKNGATCSQEEGCPRTGALLLAQRSIPRRQQPVLA